MVVHFHEYIEFSQVFPQKFSDHIPKVPSGSLLLLCCLNCLSILGCCVKCGCLCTGLGRVCGVLHGVVRTGWNEVCSMLEMW